MQTRGPRFLISGATGFVGSYVLRRLLADSGMPAVALLLRPQADVWRIRELLPRVRRIDGDLTAVAGAEAAVTEFAPETLIHLAWTGVTNAHRDDPAQVDNVRGTVELVQLAARAGVRHFIGLGSQAEYGPQHGALREDAPTRPTTLYGASKLATAFLAERLCELAGMRFAWLRLFSAYGPTDDPSWFIPYLFGRLLKGERPALTAGEQRWDYLYVADAAEAIVRVAQERRATGLFNLGSGRVVTIREVAERIRALVVKAIGSVPELGFGELPYRPDQVMHLEAEIAKISAATGFSPATPLDDGLRAVLEWCRRAAQAKLKLP